MKKQNFYITTTLPYVNADPHIGFALEIVQADAIARYQKLLGNNVFFNTGTDEHGQKIYQNALDAQMDPKKYCDQYAEKFRLLKNVLNLFDEIHFIRTTDENHVLAAQEFWKRCDANGDIYKKMYKVKYCVGCELEKTDSELVDGTCPIHPNREIEFIEEENYFFKWSNYQDALLKLYDTNPEFVVPANRLQEVRNFVASGLQDFSISRIASKMPWGIPVPGDSEHVMYVWFDALVNYISTLGWSEKDEDFEKFWGTKKKSNAVQVAGKDNLRQQSAMWQGMLMSAGIPTSKQIFIHGFITSEGQKMSKSLGNVVNPIDVVKKYSTDAVRYYLLGALPSYDDGDWSEERFEEFYTAHLANGVGNLTHRILTMIEKYCDNKIPEKTSEDIFAVKIFWKEYIKLFENYSFDEVIQLVNKLVAQIDTEISQYKPWEKAKAGESINGHLYQIAEGLFHLGVALLPLIPSSAEKILSSLGVDCEKLSLTDITKWGILEPEQQTKKGEPVFPRPEKK